jgi:hypothetical protein
MSTIGHWKDYNDPDGETEFVRFNDQGLIHEITTSVKLMSMPSRGRPLTSLRPVPVPRPRLAEPPGYRQRLAARR